MITLEEVKEAQRKARVGETARPCSAAIERQVTELARAQRGREPGT